MSTYVGPGRRARLAGLLRVTAESGTLGSWGGPEGHTRRGDTPLENRQALCLWVGTGRGTATGAAYEVGAAPSALGRLACLGGPSLELPHVCVCPSSFLLFILRTLINTRGAQAAQKACCRTTSPVQYWQHLLPISLHTHPTPPRFILSDGRHLN